MLASAELRWFWKGPRPGLQEWFSSSATGSPQEERRADLYLRQAGQRELGMKQRGHALGVELKALVAEGTTHTIGILTAPTQIWTKVWTDAFDLQGLPTISVHKSRRMVSHSAGAHASGCNVEITEARVDGGSDVWTTLGFEAYGALDRLEDVLAGVVRLYEANPPPVDPGLALSYPGWLATLATRRP